MAPSAEPGEVVVGEVLDQGRQPRVRPEEVLPDVVTGFHREPLELPVQGGVHLVDQHAVGVSGQ